MLIHNFSKLLAGKLADSIGWRDKINILAYGLELVLGELFKFGMLIIISIYFRVLVPTLLILAAALPFRLVSGGGHCSTQSRCTILTVLVYVFLSFIGNRLTIIITPNLTLILLPLITAITLIIIRLWVPRENPHRKIESISEITRFKRLSNLFVLLWVTSCLVLYLLAKDNTFERYFLFTAIGIILQDFAVSPVGYRFVSMVEGAFDTHKRIKEVN